MAGDIRNYGANDYVVMTKGALAIEYYQNDGLGNFTLNENISKRVSDNFTGRPVAGELIDLNTDGRLDLIVASTYNGESKLQVFLNSGEEQRFELPILVPLGNPSVQNETSLTSSISSIAVGDYDNDLDVDIAIAFPDIEQVRWYSNEGNASFAFEGSIKDIGAPRLLESFSFAGKDFADHPMLM